MSRILSCPRCQKAGLLRSYPQSPREHLASFLFVAPFRCPSCSHRFLATYGWTIPRIRSIAANTSGFPCGSFSHSQGARFAARERYSISRWAAVSSRVRPRSIRTISSICNCPLTTRNLLWKWPRWFILSALAALPSSSFEPPKKTSASLLSSKPRDRINRPNPRAKSVSQSEQAGESHPPVV
jgi:hypothetical protein